MITSHFWTRTLAAAAMLVAGTTISFAGPFEDGANHYNRRNYQAALASWRNLSQTDATVQNNIGIMYMDGKGVARNLPLAAQWLARSAANGSSLGQNNLGGMYRDGKGVNRDFARALTYFSASAAQGNAAGQMNLGYMYLYGQGIRQDLSRAYMWFDLAAAQDNSGLLKAAYHRSLAASRMSPQQQINAHAAAQRCADNNFKNCG
jgi:TPR repeat protein